MSASHHPASGCSQVRGCAAEVALDVVSGPERAAVMAHLATCGECRVMVDDLARLADELLLLAPAVEPPIGFEGQVVTGLPAAIAAIATGADEAKAAKAPPDRAARHRRSSRRTMASVLAATAVALLMAGAGAATGVALGGSDTRTATAVGPGSAGTARALVYGSDPAWIFVDLEGTGSSEEELIVNAIVDGSARRLGMLRLDRGYGALGARLQVSGSQVDAVTLADRHGETRHYLRL